MNDRKQKVNAFYIISFGLLRRKAMKLKGKIIIGAMVLAAISGMQSMAAEKEVYQLGEVLVTANKYSVPDLEIPAATEVISGQQIENMGAKSVMEVMKNIPGFVISESPFGNGNPGIRGISGHMSIMINGIPLNQDYYFQMGTLSATSIDRIEVVKGGVSGFIRQQCDDGRYQYHHEKG